jgi:hypothetical protein
MPAGKPEQTPEQRALRLRGYELWLTTDEEGKRRSMRSVAMALGVTLGTIQYWRRVDKWDERLKKSLGVTTAANERASGALGALLRQSLYEHISTLNDIIRDAGTKVERKLAAIKELGNLAHKLKAISPADLMESSGPPKTFDFKDDLDGHDDGHGRDGGDAGTPAARLPADDHDDDAAGSAAGGGCPADGGSPGDGSDPSDGQ